MFEFKSTIYTKFYDSIGNNVLLEVWVGSEVGTVNRLPSKKFKMSEKNSHMRHGPAIEMLNKVSLLWQGRSLW